MKNKNNHPLISFFNISNSYGFAIFPSPFLSMAAMNCVTCCAPTSLFLPSDLKASLMRQNISLSSRVPLLSASYLLKIASMACLSCSSDGFEDIRRVEKLGLILTMVNL
jgi:hypothetical protein